MRPRKTREELASDFYDELDLVYRRYNDLILEDPAGFVALTINMADSLRDKLNVEIEREETEDGRSAFYLRAKDQEYAAFLGFARDEAGAIDPDDLSPDMEIEEGPP